MLHFHAYEMQKVKDDLQKADHNSEVVNFSRCFSTSFSSACFIAARKSLTAVTNDLANLRAYLHRVSLHTSKQESQVLKGLSLEGYKCSIPLFKGLQDNTFSF